MFLNGILQQFYSRTNYLLSDFSMLLSNVIKDLHKLYCMNIYGSEFNFNKSYMDNMCVMLCKIIGVILTMELIIIVLTILALL